MRKSKLKKHIQDKLIEHFVAGTTARCAAELIAGTVPTIFPSRKATKKYLGNGGKNND
jgi:hypothetical protein